jgi:polyisoprenoid-binding protein YceI
MKNFILSVVVGYLFLTTSSISFGDEEPVIKKIQIKSQDAVTFKVEADVKVMSLTIVGQDVDLEGSVELDKDMATGQFKIDLSQFKTGLSSRDEHLMKTFEVDKYQFAYLQFKDVKFVEGEFPFRGLMKLHGVSKEVAGVAFKKGKDIKATMIVKKSDFNLDVPDSIAKKLGAKVAEKVEIEVKFSI